MDHKSNAHDDEKHVNQSQVSEKEIADEARIATTKEHGLTVRQGLKAYRKAIGWSILLSSAVIMEGYDTILLHGKLPLTGYLVNMYGNKKVMTGATMMMIAFFIASGVLVGVQPRTDQWGWRIPFAIQWVWPIPIIFVCLFCPESPTWLVEHERELEAEKAVSRLQSSSSAHNIPSPRETVALLSQTNMIEKRLTLGAGYLECFRGTNRRRTEIAVGTWVTQQMCGPVLQTYAIYAIAFVGTVLSWPMINMFGRRTIFLGGLAGIFVSLLIVGFISWGPASSTSVSWAIGAFLLIFTFIYDSTVGPLTYVIVPEAPSSRLRHKTIVIARNMYNITCIWTGVITPYMLNTTAWNWG
ncbi:uncharacterized protein IL334_000004 [Kwoniella shivajii]|uniref:Major facilitator superfamily (MFS) profile domain-containing protein n=1 Tax=Kwoniella shivajii TaxID=564305 RepID=A0ABZ1CMX2_9TREE|nr:hypothetical protein IL334_000004 [Kwoniella shivajii]